MPSQYPTPLITLPQPDGVDLSMNLSTSITYPGDFDLSQNIIDAGAVYAEQNTYTFVAEVSGNVIVFTEVDVIAWDASDNVIYTHVDIDGYPNIFANEINAQISVINQIIDDPSDNQLVSEITALVDQIKCTNLEGMGTITDYTDLLKIAKDISGNVDLAFDISTLETFASNAEAYGDLFQNISKTLTAVTTISDVNLLTSIKAQLEKIAGMFDALKALKVSISATATLQIPDSIQGVADKLETVYEEMDCALNYLDYFCTGTNAPANSALSLADKSAIEAAKGALNTFNTLVSNNAKVSASSNIQISNLTTRVNAFSSINQRMSDAKSCLDSALKAALLL